MILKTRVKINVHILGPSSHASAMANCKGSSTPFGKKMEKGKIIKLLDHISEFIYSIDVPEI